MTILERVNTIPVHLYHLKERRTRILILGIPNVGKSTFINTLTSLTLDKKTDITVSNMPSTTLDMIKIPLPDKTYLYDMPGIINKHQITYYLKKETINQVLPKKFIKPKVFQINPGQTLFIGGFCAFNYIEGEKASFVTTFSNSLVLHRTKLENSKDFYEKHKDDILLIPTEEERKLLGEIKKIRFAFEGKKDICVSGLGFLTVHGKGIIEVASSEFVKVSIRDSLI